MERQTDPDKLIDLRRIQTIGERPPSFTGFLDRLNSERFQPVEPSVIWVTGQPWSGKTLLLESMSYYYEKAGISTDEIRLRLYEEYGLASANIPAEEVGVDPKDDEFTRHRTSLGMGRMLASEVRDAQGEPVIFIVESPVIGAYYQNDEDGNRALIGRNAGTSALDKMSRGVEEFEGLEYKLYGVVFAAKKEDKEFASHLRDGVLQNPDQDAAELRQRYTETKGGKGGASRENAIQYENFIRRNLLHLNEAGMIRARLQQPADYFDDTYGLGDDLFTRSVLENYGPYVLVDNLGLQRDRVISALNFWPRAQTNTRKRAA